MKAIGRREEYTTVVVVGGSKELRSSICRSSGRDRLVLDQVASAEELLPMDFANTDVFLIWKDPLVITAVRERMSALDENAPIVAYSTDKSVPSVVAALSAGAIAFLEWPAAIEQLVDVVTEALANWEKTSPRWRTSQQASRRLARLSEREREVVAGIALGQSNKQIARELKISHRTVEIYRANAFRKLGAGNAAGVVRLVLEAEWDHCRSCTMVAERLGSFKSVTTLLADGHVSYGKSASPLYCAHPSINVRSDEEARVDTFRAAILADFVDVARFVGVDPFAILEEARIDPRWLDDPDAELSLTGVIQVLERSASESGRDDFGLLLAQTRIFSSLGPVSLLLEHEHSVRSVLDAAIEFRPLVNDSLAIRIEEDGDTSFIHFQLPSKYSTPQLLSHIVAVASTVLVDASGGSWHPTGAHFRQSRPQWISTYERHFRCALWFDDTFDGLSCPSSSLDTAVPSAEPLLATYARRLLNLCPRTQRVNGVTEHVRNAIQLLLRDGAPTLARASASLATSPRTIQRLLRLEGQTFEGVTRQVRKDLAIRYLTQSSQDVTQIAYNLGFSGLGAFSRWFKAEFGVSPSKWRKDWKETGHLSNSYGPDTDTFPKGI